MCHKRRNARRAFIEQQMMVQQSQMMGGGGMPMGMAMAGPMYAPRRRGPICGLIAMATKPLMMSSHQNQQQPYGAQFQQPYGSQQQFQPQYQQAPMQQQQPYGQAPQYQARDVSPGEEQHYQQQRGFEEYKDEKSLERLPAYEPVRDQQRMTLPERTKN